MKNSKLYQYVNKNAAAFGLFIAIMAVSTAAIFIRLAQQNLSSLVIATYRLVLATLFLAPFSISKVRKEKHLITKSDRNLLALSGVLLGLHFASWVTSLEFTNVVSSTVLVTTSPVWVTLFSPLVLKERLPKAFTFGLLIAVAGILMVSFSNVCGVPAGELQCSLTGNLLGREALKGNFLALVGAWCASAYMMCGRKVRSHLSNQSYSFIVYAVAALTLLVISIASRQALLQVRGHDWIWLVLLALIPQIVGHSLLNWALGKLPAAYVSLSLLGEPPGSAVLAFIFLDEKPTLLQVIGSVVIIYGIYRANKPQRKQIEAEVEIIP
jgi:drug/metabolite transporter (DMT)-like permease